MYRFVKPLFFLLSPEKAHRAAMWLLNLAASFAPSRGLLRRFFTLPAPALRARKMGLDFPNPIGLAAGFDKDGKHIEGLACLGFGFIEVGTVTPLAQEGNPRPRLFRLPLDRALINRMGFNNEGLDALVGRLRRLRARNRLGGLVIGGNIGKNKATPNEQAADDYVRCFEALFPYVDYFAVNVSSPNTPGLRDLQEKEPLTRLLALLQEKNRAMPQPKPLLLKIAPDLTDGQLDDIADIARTVGLAGVIATNTTIARTGLAESPARIAEIGAGGLSGAPVRERSTAVVRFLRQRLGSDFVIIGVGGVDSPESAAEKLEAGADLVQVYTGFIYEGPGLARKVLAKMAESIKE